METQNKQIAHLQDFELIKLLEVCSELFGTVLKQPSARAFVYMLRQKFNFTTDKKILDSCLEYASNPSQEQGKRFNPSLLASIIVTKNKEKFPEYRNEFNTSQEEKIKYKEKFIRDLCDDFEDYCKRIEPSRIFIWVFVAQKLKENGIISEKEYDGADKSLCTIKHNFYNQYRELCLLKFKDMAMQNKHIIDYIN